MPRLNKKQLAVLIGRDEKYINTYVHRKQLVMSGGKFDTENEINASWIATRPKKGSQGRTSTGREQLSGKNLTELTREKRQLDNEKTRREIAVLELKEDRLRGENMPT